MPNLLFALAFAVLGILSCLGLTALASWLAIRFEKRQRGWW
jgi:hypothetical protein